MLAFIVACSDDDDKDNKSPIKGLEMPQFENPVKPGESITIKGEGFTKTSEIWFKQIITKATENTDVKAAVTDVSSTGITFTAPEVYGNQSVLLKENGKEYELGKMTFEEQPEEGGDIEILPKKIKKIVYREDNSEDVSEYYYDETGKIKTWKLIESGNNGVDYTFTYSSDLITIAGDNDKETFRLKNGKLDYYKFESTGDFDEYTYFYNGDYLNQVKCVIEKEYHSTIDLSFIGGKLTQYKCTDDENPNGEYSTINFTYGQQLNNLNLDLFGLIIDDFEDELGQAFILGIGGKRSLYLPEKYKVTGMEEDDGKFEYEVSFKYETKDNYITKIIINEDGDKYEYEIFYED